MEKRNIVRNQKGFTLIEIIAVLVIMGVLAAVAVPKYFELTTNAEAASINAAGAEIQARINQSFADQLLANNGDCSVAALAIAYADCLADLGDFTAVASSGTLAEGATMVVTITSTGSGYSADYDLTIPTCGASSSS